MAKRRWDRFSIPSQFLVIPYFSSLSIVHLTIPHYFSFFLIVPIFSSLFLIVPHYSSVSFTVLHYSSFSFTVPHYSSIFLICSSVFFIFLSLLQPRNPSYTLTWPLLLRVVGIFLLDGSGTARLWKRYTRQISFLLISMSIYREMKQ